MKLAEALAQRADGLKKLASLRSRIEANATYQEGEAPKEDANELLGEVSTVLDTLEGLMRRINITNTTAKLGSGDTLTAAIARRDILRLRVAVLNEAASAGSGSRGSWGRQLRSELRTMSAVDVQQLRKDADEISVQLRELDLAIQEANWQFDLVD